MKFIYIILLLLNIQICLAQENLIPNGDFEARGNYSIPVSDFNPLIPCSDGYFGQNLTVGQPFIAWEADDFTHTGGDDNVWSLFDKRANPTYIQNLIAIYSYNCEGGGGAGGSGEDQVNFGSPYYQSPDHYLPTGGDVIGRYAGHDYNFWNNPTLKVKLKRPLKCGYTYHLKFRAYKSDGNGHIQMRFGTGGNFGSDHVTINGTDDNIDIDVDVEDQWVNYDCVFYVDDPNTQWFFVKPAPAISGTIFFDDFELLDQCGYDAQAQCSSTFNTPITVYCNNYHSYHNPLRFFNTGNLTNFNLTITPVSGGLPVRTISLINPPPSVTWDGLNDNGAVVANGNYVYELVYGTDCECGKLTSNFTKVSNEDYGLNANISVDGATNALKITGLSNVNKLHLIVTTTSGASLANLEYSNPPDPFLWNGYDQAGHRINVNPFMDPSPYYVHVEAIVENNCAKRKFKGDVVTMLPIADADLASNPGFDYSLHYRAPLECSLGYMVYQEYPHPPLPCCKSKIAIQDIDRRDTHVYEAVDSIEAGSNANALPGSTVVYHAGGEIVLKDGFTAFAGTDFNAAIQTCTRMETIPNNNPAGDYPAGTILVNGVPAKPFDENRNLISLYPNPNSGNFTISYEGKENNTLSMLNVYDNTGKTVFTQGINIAAGSKKEISVNIARGVYIAEIIDNTGVKTIKRIVIEN